VSRERARAREARQEARRLEVEAAAAERARSEKRTLRVPALPRRRRRFGQLSSAALARLVALYLAVQAVFWLLFPSFRTRAALAVISLAFLLVLVRTRERTPR
jgi:Flp pilus assembly protein TadB